jgi:hypothetical protein
MNPLDCELRSTVMYSIFPSSHVRLQVALPHIASLDIMSNPLHKSRATPHNRGILTRHHTSLRREFQIPNQPRCRNLLDGVVTTVDP